MAESLTSRFQMRGIWKTFGGTTALDGVDLAVAPGEICGLVGQNGAGKSTLMGILSGALQPDAGSMTLDDRPYAPRSPSDARSAGVAMIYQELSLAPHLSVAENIALGVEPTRFGLIRRSDMRSMATRALTELAHPDIDPDRPVGELSVAEQQLVEIARALAIDCRVLVLDEPTSSLGKRDVARLFELMRQLRAQHHAIVYISHFIEEVKEIADRVVVLRDGKMAGSGTVTDMSSGEIVRLMVGRPVETIFPRTARTRGEPILEVTELSPGSATFTLHRGEIVGIAGLLGAGRTELLRALFGLEPVRSGHVKLGAYSGVFSPHARWQQGMGMVSEDRKGEGLALGLAISDNLTLSHLDGLGPWGSVLPSRQEATTKRWLERLGIRSCGPRQVIGELSGGNQQKVALARLLHHDVDVLVLDEPTRGIDVASKTHIYELLDRLVSDLGGDKPRAKAILMVSSYPPELLGLSDRIAVMRRGRLGPMREVAEWDEHALMTAATGAGEAA